MSPLYNRYIPQSDGSYRRRSVQDQRREPPPRQPPPEPVYCPGPPPPPAPPPPQPCRKKPDYPCPAPGAGSFLRNLLPADLDMEDLLVIVLLLLMNGDCKNDSNLPLLTLALYLFL